VDDHGVTAAVLHATVSSRRVIAYTSPRTTQLLHQRRDLTRLTHVGRVGSERPRLGGQPGAPVLSLGGLRDRLARRLRARDPAPSRDLVERAQPIAAET
jgi:hypothetical protein